ncbi:hypothetical protein C8R46DRAFT_1065892, partial [Mycena filopes]
MPAIPWPAGWSKVEPPEEIKNVVGRARSKLDAIPGPVLALSAFALGSATTLSGTFLYRRYFRRIINGDWITPDVFARKRWTTFASIHTPAFGWRWPVKFRRIPSTAKGTDINHCSKPAAHFGRPSQPYSEEALAWLREEILGKTYSRVVSIVTMNPRLLPGSWAAGKSLSLEMLKAGWVTTYEQAGAEYGKWGKEEFLRVENEAKAARRGMWANGTSAESPAEYKRRHALAESLDTKVVDKRAAIERKPTNAPTSSKTVWFGS